MIVIYIYHVKTLDNDVVLITYPSYARVNHGVAIRDENQFFRVQNDTHKLVEETSPRLVILAVYNPKSYWGYMVRRQPANFPLRCVPSIITTFLK